MSRSTRPKVTPGTKTSGRSELTAAQALARTLSDYRLTMNTKEPGVLDDQDIEALHDFRVALRRTRSLIRNLGHLCETRAIRRFRSDFAWLARATGPQRDLDVFLAQLDAPPRRIGSAAGVLQPLRAEVQSRRLVAHTRLVRVLHSSRYWRLKADWFHFLNDLRAQTTSTDRLQAETSAAIDRAYRKIGRRGRTIAARIKTKRLHKVRKDGKELRYLLEAFPDLYDQRLVARLIGELKKLQNTLGTVCDLDVQREMLLEMANDKHACLPRSTTKALRRWARALRKQGRDAKEKCAAQYARFMRQCDSKTLKSLAGDAAP
jgi:CHAD domain-containing protein